MPMVVKVSGAPAPVEDRRGQRRAGWAAVAAAVAFLVQPLSVGFLPFNLEEVRDPVELSRYWWAGTLQAVEFTVVALAVLVLVSALRPLWHDGPGGGVTYLLGCISGGAFLLQASLSAATYSWWLMQDASEFSPDPQVRSAILFGTFVAGYAFLGLANLASAGWIIGLVISGRHRGWLGVPFSVFALAVAALLAVGTLLGFAIPTVIVHLLFWIMLGVKLLRSAPAP